MLGHSGFTLLPSMPWQATQGVDFAWPASFDPAASAGAADASAAVQSRVAATLVVMRPSEGGSLQVRIRRRDRSSPVGWARELYTTASVGSMPAAGAMSAYPNVKFLTSANARKQFPTDSGAEVAIAGRSNAGKSSALNALTGRKALARTSQRRARRA